MRTRFIINFPFVTVSKEWFPSILPFRTAPHHRERRHPARIQQTLSAVMCSLFISSRYIARGNAHSQRPEQNHELSYFGRMLPTCDRKEQSLSYYCNSSTAAIFIHRIQDAAAPPPSQRKEALFVPASSSSSRSNWKWARTYLPAWLEWSNN